MKRIAAIAIVALMGLFATSCTSSQTEVREVTTQFLTAYFQTDYATAVTLCTDRLGEILEMTLADREFADEGLKEKVNEASQKTTFNILSVDTKSVPGEAYIQYEIISPLSPAPIRKELTATKVDKVWKISGMK